MLSSSTHCAKHKKRANNICGTQKCFTNNFYQNAGMTRCPYYLHEDCGHNGKLRAVKGIKIRKTLMIFNLGIYVPIYVGLFLFFILMDLFRQTNYMADSHEAIPILPFMVLIPNLVSVLFMGRVVAVCNKQGIYTNDPLVTWNEIAELRYTALVPSRHNYTMCLTFIRVNIGQHKNKPYNWLICIDTY